MILIHRSGGAGQVARAGGTVLNYRMAVGESTRAAGRVPVSRSGGLCIRQIHAYKSGERFVDHCDIRTAIRRQNL
jgi:hypothetical protein